MIIVCLNTLVSYFKCVYVYDCQLCNSQGFIGLSSMLLTCKSLTIHIAPATISACAETETEVTQDDFKYFQLDCPRFTDNAIIELTVISGQSAIYASTEIVNPSPVNSVGVTQRNEDIVSVGSVKTLTVPINGKTV